MTEIFLEQCPGCGYKNMGTGYVKVERALYSGGKISIAVLECGCKIDAFGRKIGTAGPTPEGKPIWALDQAGLVPVRKEAEQQQEIAVSPADQVGQQNEQEGGGQQGELSPG